MTKESTSLEQCQINVNLFFDSKGIVHKEFDPSGQKLTGKFYCDVLRQLRENIWRKRPDKWCNISWARHHHNARAHVLLIVQQFLASMTTVTAYKWVPVTSAWHVLRLGMEEWPPIRRVAATILNKQSRTADEGWSSSLRFGRGANKPPREKTQFRNIHKASCFLWRQTNLEVIYSTTRNSGGE